MTLEPRSQKTEGGRREACGSGRKAFQAEGTATQGQWRKKAGAFQNQQAE